MSIAEPKYDVRDTDTGNPLEAHIVKKSDQMRGYIAGEEITAICGTKFIPSRDYEGLPVCSSCLSVAEQMRNSGNN